MGLGGVCSVDTEGGDGVGGGIVIGNFVLEALLRLVLRSPE